MPTIAYDSMVKGHIKSTRDISRERQRGSKLDYSKIQKELTNSQIKFESGTFISILPLLDILLPKTLYTKFHHQHFLV